MIEVSHLNEKKGLKALPQEIQENIQEILQILDKEYESEKLKYEDDGGYVAILEKKEDFQQIKNNVYIDYAI